MFLIWVSVRRKANSFQELTNVSRSFGHAQDKEREGNLKRKCFLEGIPVITGQAVKKFT